MQTSDQSSIRLSSRTSVENEKYDNWERKVMDQLDAMDSIGPNWDSYGAEAPNLIAIEHARDIINEIIGLNLKPTIIAPCPDEGITLTFIKNKKMASIETYNTGEIIAIISREDGLSDVHEVDPDSPRIDIEKIQHHLSL